VEYDFTQREREFDRVVLVLTLDREKMTERIVIAKSTEARRRLERGGGEVFYDESRPLGQLLLTLEADPDRQWNRNAALLHESYGKAVPFEKERWKQAAPASTFLQEKAGTGEPAARFAAIRTWEEYLNCFHLNHGPQRFLDGMTLLYRPFFLYGDCRPWQEEAVASLSHALHDGESQVELWYPVKKRPFECVVAFASLQPLIFYYRHKLEEWGLLFRECKVCGNYFLAKNRHFEICSDACRRAQAADAKRRFDESARGDRLEQLHEAAYYYWYNRLRKLKRAKQPDTEKLAEVTAAFEAFRAEAVRQKKEIRSGRLKLSEFASWLAQQQNAADSMMRS
jgi:hypothetical protein